MSEKGSTSPQGEKGGITSWADEAEEDQGEIGPYKPSDEGDLEVVPPSRYGQGNYPEDDFTPAPTKRGGGKGGESRPRTNERDRGSSYKSTERRPERRKQPFPTEPPYKAFVGNIDFQCSEDDVWDYFTGSACKIKDLRFVRGRENDFKGFCYIEFKDAQSLKEALALDSSDFHGRNIRVDIAESRDRDGGGRGGGRSFRGGSGGFRGGGDSRSYRDDSRSYRESPRKGGYRDEERRSFPPRDDYRESGRRSSYPRRGGFSSGSGRGGRYDPSPRSERPERSERFSESPREAPKRRPKAPVSEENPEATDEAASKERPKLQLKPRSSKPPPGITSPPLADTRNNEDNPFGAALPRELILQKRGQTAEEVEKDDPIKIEDVDDDEEKDSQRDRKPTRGRGRGRGSGGRGFGRGGGGGGGGRGFGRGGRGGGRSDFDGDRGSPRKSPRVWKEDRSEKGRDKRSPPTSSTKLKPKAKQPTKAMPKAKKKIEDEGAVSVVNTFDALSMDDDGDAETGTT